MTAVDLIFWTVGLAAGASVGSFLATAARRTGRNEQWLSGRSCCDLCRAPVLAARSVPLLSYAMSRGACYACGGPIHASHPAGEFVGLGVAAMALALGDPTQIGLGAVVGYLLLAIALIDAETLRIPNALNLSLAVVGLLAAGLGGREALVVALLAGGLGLLVMTGLKLAFARISGRDGLGWGDVKLVGVIGLLSGPALPWAVALASAGGLLWALVAKPEGRFPFGPFLAGAALIVWFGGRLWPTI